MIMEVVVPPYAVSSLDEAGPEVEADVNLACLGEPEWPTGNGRWGDLGAGGGKAEMRC